MCSAHCDTSVSQRDAWTSDAEAIVHSPYTMTTECPDQESVQRKEEQCGRNISWRSLIMQP